MLRGSKTGLALVGRVRRALLAVVLCLSLGSTAAPAAALVAPSPAAASATSSADPVVRDTLADVIDDGDIQTSFVEPPEPVPPTPPPAWLTDLFGWLMGDGNGIITGLGWVLVGLIVLGALYLTVPWVRDLFDAMIARFRKAKPEDEAGADLAWAPDEGGARNLLAEADRLASEGRFDEAAHLLLGRSLEDIGNRRPGLLKPALTARAIAVMAELPGPARNAFGRIAAIVERSLWARQALDQSAWQDARSAYEDFAFGAHWRGVSA